MVCKCKNEMIEIETIYQRDGCVDYDIYYCTECGRVFNEYSKEWFEHKRIDYLKDNKVKIKYFGKLKPLSFNLEN